MSNYLKCWIGKAVYMVNKGYLMSEQYKGKYLRVDIIRERQWKRDICIEKNVTKRMQYCTHSTSFTSHDYLQS